MKTSILYFIFILITLFASIQIGYTQSSSTLNKEVITKNKKYVGSITKVTQDSIFIMQLDATQVVLAKAAVIRIYDKEKLDSESGVLRRIELENGQNIIGEIAKISEDSIKVHVLTIDKNDIKNIHTNLYTKRINYSSQPFYLPTAYGLGSDNYYFRTYYGLLYDFSFGITKRLNFSVGTEALSLLTDNSKLPPIMQFGAKYELGNIAENLTLGIGGKYAYNPDEKRLLLYVPFTFGNRKSNITLLPTYLVNDGENIFTLSINFNVPINRNLYLSSDALYIDDSIAGTLLVNIASKSGTSFGLGALFRTKEGIIPNLIFSTPLSGKWNYDD